MLGEITKVGFWILEITDAIEKVFPEPVTPKSTWCLAPDCKFSISCFMAFGWSPLGLYLDVSLNMVE